MSSAIPALKLYSLDPRQQAITLDSANRDPFASYQTIANDFTPSYTVNGTASNSSGSASANAYNNLSLDGWTLGNTSGSNSASTNNYALDGTSVVQNQAASTASNLPTSVGGQNYSDYLNSLDLSEQNFNSLTTTGSQFTLNGQNSMGLQYTVEDDGNVSTRLKTSSQALNNTSTYNNTLAYANRREIIEGTFLQTGISTTASGQNTIPATQALGNTVLQALLGANGQSNALQQLFGNAQNLTNLSPERFARIQERLGTATGLLGLGANGAIGAQGVRTQNYLASGLNGASPAALTGANSLQDLSQVRQAAAFQAKVDIPVTQEFQKTLQELQQAALRQNNPYAATRVEIARVMDGMIPMVASLPTATGQAFSGVLASQMGNDTFNNMSALGMSEGTTDAASKRGSGGYVNLGFGGAFSGGTGTGGEFGAGSGFTQQSFSQQGSQQGSQQQQRKPFMQVA